MSDKPGRNDPCPCGSGKKYKHCCMKKGVVIPFPSGKGRDVSMDDYMRFAESWDSSRGPVPSYMEFRGTPNPASESLNEIKRKIGDRVFESLEEAQAFFDKEFQASNSAPREDFLGLSPVQMHAILANRFSGNRDIVSLNPDASRESIEAVPAVIQCRYLFEQLREDERGIKATQKGNLPRALVRDFYDRFVKETKVFDFTPTGEDDLVEIKGLRYFLEDSGFMKKRDGRFRLTKKAEPLMAPEGAFALYRALFLYFAESWNWLYSTRFPENFDFFQKTLVFCLRIVKHKAARFTTGEELAGYFKTAFPQFAGDIKPIGEFDMLASGFCLLFLERFARFMGLVEMERDEGNFMGEEARYRKTGFFDEVLRWGV
ncbi:MAG: hypothetical protein EPN93_06085 [Spirochaetes bacterium]|nr:MAG: hypothetical protein EPN93_06085 [Spirochaetota bacterium]